MHKTLDVSASTLPIGFPPPEYRVEDIWWEDHHTVIYRALRKPDLLRVLLKTSRDSSQAPQTRVDSLEREYQITQSLVTDCAAKPFALEKTALGSMLVYADEGFRPLEELAAKAPCDLETVLTLGISIAEAVNSLHKEQIIHCNLNPTTVWLQNDSGKILLSDFNCTRVTGEDYHNHITLTTDLADVRYIAPEQTGRLQRHVDQRSDLYALGIILFRLLTGKVPFSGGDPLHIIDGHLTKKPVFPAEMKTRPNILCNVILKALSKNPDDRYLSASGLVADLRECLAQWQANGIIKEFELGRQDAKGFLRISRRLYGRDRPTAWLWEKAGTVGREKPTILLVRGPPGVGKSALLDKLAGLHRPEGYRLISGKFDQFKRNVPYLPLVQAFQQLFAQLIGEGKEEVDAWRSRILESIGTNAEVVSAVIPELRLITGVQPPVQSLPPIQARNRFNSIFTSLIRVLAPNDRPLCLVLEDLHWADAASLGLLAYVFTAVETQNLLIVGAYRDTEVGPTHPLQQTIVLLEQAGVNIHILALEELGLNDISQLVRDTFDASDAEAYELAEVLHAKTSGNPLYVTQLLHFLCDRGLIQFDYGSARWVWEVSCVQKEGVTEDVLNLLDMRFENLDQCARSVLATAACLGSGFEVGKLAVATEMLVTEVLAFVTAAVDQGFLLRLEEPTSASGGLPTENYFRFLHDRIQQAAFDSVSEDAKKGFRLKIGLRLMAALAPGDEGAPQPDVLSNLNYAWELITDPEVMRCAAQLNLIMGRKARHSLAYDDALSYIRVGLSLLETTAWESNYELAFELNSEALECEYLTGNFDQAELRFGTLIANSQSRLDEARTYLTKILLDTSEERYEQAIRLGKEALGLFGIAYLRKPSQLHLLRELVEAQLRMKGRRPETLLDNIGLQDAEKLAALRILVALFPTAYFLSPDLLLFTGLKVVNFSLRFGISPLSAGGFVLYGLGLGAAMDQHERGYQFGRFAVDLAEKGNDPSILCKVIVIFAQFIKFWRDPIDESFALIDRARTMALEVGDHQYVDYAIIGGISLRFSRGRSLQEVLQHCEEHSAFVLRSKDAFPVEALTMWRNCVLTLLGRTVAPYSLNHEAYDEDAAEQRYHHTGNITLASYQYTLRLQLAYLFGRYEEAIALAEKSETVIRSAPGYITVADHYLYCGMTAAAALNGAFPNRRRHWRTLRRCLKRLQHFAANSPTNFLHCETLLKAEIAWLKGQVTEALKHYDRTIELAESGGFTPIVGLANERAAQCCIANHQRRVANWYRDCARAAYVKWGASAKVTSLDRQHGTATEVARDIDTPSDHRSLTDGASFDIAAAMHAARIISSGNKTDQVLTHLMQVIRLQISAETAHLLVVEDGEVQVEASATVERGSVLLFPPSEAAPFSATIVNYVMHTGHDVIVSDACEDPRFAECSHVKSQRPKSVICMGVRHQGQILGLIYLEHTQLSGVFDAPKVEWLRILATEVGLMLWSGRLSRYREYVRKLAPTAVSEQIDANPTKPDLAAKDCDISILFADLQGYTHLAELMPPKQLHHLVSRVFSKFVDEVHRYDGAVLEIRGDELFVMFTDDEQSRHARKAANTALAIGRAAARINFELEGSPFPLLMNIGINSGLACVGLQEVQASTGSRWRYGATGSMVNIAARVRELAHNGDILIGAASAARVSEDFILEDLGAHTLKNVMSSVNIYRLVGERSR